MGNENSTFKQNKYLSKDEASALVKTFPPKPSQSLWKSWYILEESARVVLESQLKDPAKGCISWEKYQDLAGNVLLGTLDDRIGFLLRLGGTNENAVNVQGFQQALTWIFAALETLKRDASARGETTAKAGTSAAAVKLAKSLTHDLAFPGLKRKHSVTSSPTSTSATGAETAEYYQVEKLMSANPLIESALLEVLVACFQLRSAVRTHQSSSSLATRMPVAPSELAHSFLSPLDVLFLKAALPHDLQNSWRLLFSTAVHGESFSKLVGGITNQGPSLVIVKDEKDNIFGGFATSSWKPGPKFLGSGSCFLFQLHPVMNVYDSTPFNQNYQYFNIKQKTMPNGLGMGGQLEYFGFWLDSEFGLVRSAPSCTTFYSPQLGVAEGKFKDLEVWGLGPEPQAEQGLRQSVLDMDKEAQAVMEMMGKTFHSKIIRELDKEEEERNNDL